MEKILRVEGLTKNGILEGISFDVDAGEMIAIMGPSGSGKSTLLEAIATILRLNPEGGSRNFNFSTWETHSRLYEDLRPIRADLGYRNAFFFRAESFYNVASEVDRLQREDGRMLGSYGGRSLHEQSQKSWPVHLR